MTPRRFGLSTTAVHGTPQRRADWAPIVAPLAQSTTFTSPVGSDEEVLYTRYGNNPNQVDLGRKYALLEGAEEALFVASGMGATALAHLAVLRPGDHLIARAWIYGGTRKLFDEELGRLGIEVPYVEPDQPRNWRASVRRTTRASFIETPTNPLMRVRDVEAVAQAAREHGLALLLRLGRHALRAAQIEQRRGRQPRDEHGQPGGEDRQHEPEATSIRHHAAPPRLRRSTCWQSSCLVRNLRPARPWPFPTFRAVSGKPAWSRFGRLLQQQPPAGCGLQTCRVEAAPAVAVGGSMVPIMLAPG